MSKYLLLINLSNGIGGAEIRYLNLFSEICKRKNDYILIINRKLFEIAERLGYIDRSCKNIIILEIDSYTSDNASLGVKEKKRKNTFIYYKKIKRIASSLLTFKKYIGYVYALNKLFKRQKPQYVYTVWVGGMLVWPLKYIYNFKFVYSYMDSGFSSLGTFWNHPLKSEQLPLKHADCIDFLSSGLFKGVQEKKIIKKKTKVSITPCSFKNYDYIKPVKQKSNTITFCSRMTPIKNPMLLLESILMFNTKYSNYQKITFQFLGDGECLDKMSEFVNINNLSNVALLGHVNKPIDFISKSKIFISIQQSNNYPSQSLLEAMACENAIIASDVGETRLLVTEEEGLLIALDKNELVDAIINLLNNEDKIKKLGINGRKKVLSEHNINRYLEYFYSLESLM